MVECTFNLPQMRNKRQWRINRMLDAVYACVHVKVPPMGERIHSRSLSSRVPLSLCRTASRTHALSRFACLRARTVCVPLSTAWHRVTISPGISWLLYASRSEYTPVLSVGFGSVVVSCRRHLRSIYVLLISMFLTYQ